MSAPAGHVSLEGTTGRLAQIKSKLAAQSAIPVGGRLRFFWRQWRALGAPKKVVRWLRKGYALPFRRESGQGESIAVSETCPTGLITCYKAGSEKQLALHAKIQELLVKKAIAPVPVGFKAFHNRVFLRAKKTGGVAPYSGRVTAEQVARVRHVQNGSRTGDSRSGADGHVGHER